MAHIAVKFNTLYTVTKTTFHLALNDQAHDRGVSCSTCLQVLQSSGMEYGYIFQMVRCELGVSQNNGIM